MTNFRYCFVTRVLKKGITMRVKLWSFVILLCLIGSAYAGEVIRLDFPNFCETAVMDKKMGMRVSENITIKSKVHYHEGKPVIVVDDYGYGETRWSYAPGSVEIAYEQMLKGYQLIRKQMIPQKEAVLILGGGANGLMLANRLAGEGFPVTVYAEEFSPNTLSEVKIGVFVPFLNAGKKQNSIRERIEEYSYMAYAKWVDEMEESKKGGVRSIDLYFVNDGGEIELPRRSSVIPMPSIVDIEIGHRTKVPSLRYKSFAIDTGFIMKEMMEEGKRLGVKFVNKKINDLKECMEVGASLIFNCIGLELKEKVHRNEVPLISHTMSVEGADRMDYAIYVKHTDGSYTYLFPGRNNSIRVTGTFFASTEKRATETENMNQLIARANKILTKSEE